MLNVIERERPAGVVVQFGGQTAINLAKPLAEAGVPVLGTSVDAIDRAEDRERFGDLLSDLGISQAEGRTATSIQEAMGIAMKLRFPLVVRPSYVLGGRAMEIVHDEQELLEYMTYAVRVSPDHPVLVDWYMPGKELDVDAVSDGRRVFIPGIMEHVERAGVHSGDSTAVFPPLGLTDAQVEQVVDYTRRIALALGIQGVINIQFVLHEGRLYVLEVNPRASRTVPVLSKVTGVPVVGVATRIMLGETLEEMGYPDGLPPPPPYTAVKAPVFSFEKLGRVDVYLSPEMKSHGRSARLGPRPGPRHVQGAGGRGRGHSDQRHAPHHAGGQGQRGRGRPGGRVHRERLPSDGHGRNRGLLAGAGLGGHRSAQNRRRAPGHRGADSVRRGRLAHQHAYRAAGCRPATAFACAGPRSSTKCRA